METFINDIKHRDAKLLCGYLETLSYQESVMCCRIPLWAKEIMENIAGRTIFSPTINFQTDYDNDRVAAEV